MNTWERLGETSAIWQAQCRRVVQQNQSFTTRMFAAVIASALVLPAMGAVIAAAFIGSPELLLLGFVFLIGFGVPNYIFLHWAVERYRRDQSGQNLPSSIIDERPPRLGSDGAARDAVLAFERTEWNWPLNYPAATEQRNPAG
jgi:hypothetical protein